MPRRTRSPNSADPSSSTTAAAAATSAAPLADSTLVVDPSLTTTNTDTDTDTDTNPLNRVVFVQIVLFFVLHSSVRLAELATVSSTFRDTIVNYGEAIFERWKRCNAAAFEAEFFRTCAFGIGAKLSFVPQFVAAGASPNQRGDPQSVGLFIHIVPSRNTPVLLLAVSAAAPSVVLDLIECGADINAFVQSRSQSTNMTAVKIAAVYGNLSCMKALLASGKYDFTQELPAGEFGTSLIRAVENKNTATALALIEAGAPTAPTDASGNSALVLAARTGNAALVRALVAAGAPLEAAGVEVDDYYAAERPLMAAAQRRHVECVKLLLSAGAEIDAQDDDGRTALMHAVCSGECVELLLAAGAEVDARDNGGRTALMLAVCHRDNCGKQRALVVRALVASGADVNTENRSGASAFKTTVFGFNFDVALIMLETAHPNVEVRDSCGRTPLIRVSSYDYKDSRTGRTMHRGDARCVRALLAAGADVTATVTEDNEKEPLVSKGQTALMAAAQNDSTECMDLLLGAGAPIDAENCRGSTALSIACSWFLIDNVRRLVAAGADVHKGGALIQSLGLSPWDSGASVTAGRFELVKLLLELGADVNSRSLPGQFPSGNTPLLKVLQAGGCEHLYHHAGLDVVKLLLDFGADVSARIERIHSYKECEFDNWTCLMFAAAKCPERVVSLLLDAGASKSDCVGDMTPVDVARKHRRPLGQSLDRSPNGVPQDDVLSRVVELLEL